MPAKITNDLGTVEIQESVIAKIVGMSATECSGVLGLAAADGWSDLLKKDSVDKGVRIHILEDQKVRIDISLIVQYGVSIRAVAEMVISRIHYQMDKTTGLEVEDINVIIRGIRV